MPAERQGVAKQLKAAFGFQGLRLLDTPVMRIRDGRPASAMGNWLIEAGVDFKEGQKVVVGKTGIEGSQKALILVVTGEAAEWRKKGGSPAGKHGGGTLTRAGQSRRLEERAR